MAFTVDSWSDGGLRYLVIGDPEQEDVKKLAEMFRKAARG
jgi:anti-sigma factor RsiW